MNRTLLLNNEIEREVNWACYSPGPPEKTVLMSIPNGTESIWDLVTLFEGLNTVEYTSEFEHMLLSGQMSIIQILIRDVDTIIKLKGVKTYENNPGTP